jgi:hypothetical protein
MALRVRQECLENLLPSMDDAQSVELLVVHIPVCGVILEIVYLPSKVKRFGTYLNEQMGGRRKFRRVPGLACHDIAG